MLTKNDLAMLESQGISRLQIEMQAERLARGFPFPRIVASASVEKGITDVSSVEQLKYINEWDEYLQGNHRVLKFVPASGAASRMFKAIYEFIAASRNEPAAPEEKEFFGKIKQFAFYQALNQACLVATDQRLTKCLWAGKYKIVASILLENHGLNYGQLPKGLLLFHSYQHGDARTAVEEHMAEGAMYARNLAGEVNLHFTVSTGHEQLFKDFVEKKKEIYEDKFSVKYNITFSCQKSSTDTIAAGENTIPLRNPGGTLMLRPGGHGALIENLNEIDADIVFIKNIDNVTPDSLRYSTVIYKKVLAGVLVSLQKQIFAYLNLIDSGKYSHRQVGEMISFLQDKLFTRRSDIKFLEDTELILYLRKKFHRPIRVCGMVRNESEPGGGPFLAVNPDGTTSPQIIESAQIDLSDPSQKEFFEQGTHFNPVDLVCGLKDHLGNKYHLPDYVDKDAGFISEKSKGGRLVRALELPGLWNGAMSDWNTVFVQVPSDTFTPVKIVNDLLRPEHQ
ncbi:MAG: DUF4301 family protein [Tannerellaceae bacterium]|nr:DUF4301 family protein [Tannerellaceae bacterium]